MKRPFWNRKSTAWAFSMVLIFIPGVIWDVLALIVAPWFIVKGRWAEARYNVEDIERQWHDT